MSFEAAPAWEAVLKQLREQRLVFGKRNHAVADVAGRQYVEVAAQAAGAPPVVGDRDNRGDVDLWLGICVPLQALEESRESGSSADGDNAKNIHYL